VGCSWHLLIGLSLRHGGVYETQGDSIFPNPRNDKALNNQGFVVQNMAEVMASMGAYDLSAVSGYVPAEKNHDLLISRTRLRQLFSELGRKKECRRKS
jgi:hypothetical protein